LTSAKSQQVPARSWSCGGPFTSISSEKTKSKSLKVSRSSATSSMLVFVSAFMAARRTGSASNSFLKRSSIFFVTAPGTFVETFIASHSLYDSP
jgi:hypothetical protein